MEARELFMNRKLTLDERICKLRDIGVVINGVRYHYNFQQIATATGLSRSIISQFCNGHIRIKPEQEKKLAEWVQGIEAMVLAETPEAELEDEPIEAPKEFKTKIELYQTREFKEALGLLEWTRENRKMCVMVGHPGIGKTTIIKEFSKRVPGVHVIVCRGTMRMRDLLDSIAESIGVTVGGSNDERVRRIQRELKSRHDAMLT